MNKNTELQKVTKQNEELKSSIEEKEIDLTRAQIKIAELEHLCELNTKQKDQEMNERRLLLSKNEELKKEIENKDQMNNLKIQKKLKDKPSGQLKESIGKLEESQKNQNEIKERLKIENDKVDLLEKDKIFLLNSLNITENQLKQLHETNDRYEKRINELRNNDANFNEELLRARTEVLFI